MSTWNKVLLGFATCIVSINATSGTIEFYHQRYLDRQQPVTATLAQTIQEQYFQQLIDHHDPAKGMFNQRYYIDESFSSSDNSPVFFYICGEAACGKSSLAGEIRTFAEKYHAKMIALEHRYYGVSMPYHELSAENLKYLTTENALKDLARFQTQIIKDKHWTGKWVSFGGSYPGSLSAFYRLKYPEMVVGSLASSAPVKARENFEEYDAHVTKVAGESCANKMRAAVKEVEGALGNDQQYNQIKKMFHAEEIKDKTDFVSMIAELGAGAIQYGMHDKACALLETSKTPLEGYVAFSTYIMDLWGMKPKDLVFEGAMSTSADDYQASLGMRQWFYQTCTEYGYWQTANADPAKSIRSSLINLNYYHEGCKRLFGREMDAKVDAMNGNYYSQLLNEQVSNIFFTNGSDDPWSNLSLATENGNTANKNLAYFTIQGSAHCADLHTPNSIDSDSLKESRVRLDELIAQWI